MTSHRFLDNQRNRSILGFTLSLLLHAALLLFFLTHRPPPVKEVGFFRNAPLVVNLLPPFNAAPSGGSAPSKPNPSRQSRGHPKETARREQAPRPRKAAPSRPEHTAIARAQPKAPPAPAQPAEAAPPAEDMMQMLQAARDRRRAAGIPDANDTDSEPPQQNDPDAIARANVAQSLRTRGDNDGGGVFEVTYKGVRTAELVFHGWDVLRRNVTHQAFEIDAGLGGDIDTAIVRKMIEIIRQQKTGDFNWESRRLGRVVVLSARKQDDAELEAFLKKDFFASYR